MGSVLAIGSEGVGSLLARAIKGVFKVLFVAPAQNYQVPLMPMQQQRRLIIISGLPASGKTTLGRELAKLLGFQFIDKDDILESLFAENQNFSSELRQRLRSRKRSHIS